VTKKAIYVLAAALGFLAVSVPLPAHHGGAGYDMDKQLVMKATVIDWLWANPHCFLKYDSTDDKGAVTHWAAEVSNPIDMMRRGWTKKSLNPGDQVTVTVRPAKNGEHVGQLMKVDFPNGQSLIGWGSAR
jgi:hypothetical protein